MNPFFSLFPRSRTLLPLVLAGQLFAQDTPVPRFAPHEIAFSATGGYANPYIEVTAEATLTEPDGRTTRTLPLFWDGGATWKMRFAPDRIGTWRWRVKSSDRGLDGRSGAFTCVASNRRGSIQPRAGAPHHFQFQNGEAMWFLGDTAWAFAADNAGEKHDRAAVERYVSRRAAQGFNALHFALLSELGWGNRGGAPWSDIGAETINPAYFREVDERIAFANAQGIVTGVVVAWANKGRQEPYSWGRLPGVEARQRFARYAAARYGAYDVYFIVGAEWQGEVRSRPAPRDAVRQEFVEIGNALRAADPHHRMTGIHPIGDFSTREFNGLATWMDFADYQQNYRDLHVRAVEARAVPKPVVNSEYAYFLRDMSGDGRVDKHNSYTVDDMRHATWDIVMAGAYVVAGFGSTYMGGGRHPTTFLPDDPANVPMLEQLGHMRKFFTGIDYAKLEPHDELLTSAVSRGTDRAGRVEEGDRQVTRTQPPAATYWCLAEPGQTYIVYMRGTKQPVTISGVSGRTWQTTRLDPRTGKSQRISVATADGRVSLAAPDEQDWIFLLRREGGR
jgi:hypothetical protein